VSLGAVARAVRGGIGRRRLVQTIVIALVLVASTASSVVGLALLVDSHATFDRAFSAQRGAQVVATVDPSRATAEQLAATARLSEVTRSAGPFAEANVTASYPSLPVAAPLTLAGRTTPEGLVDDIYGARELAALALAGLIIALAGALLPAAWAAQSRTATALRAE
jgi:putative ABC transport system permease protein